MSEDRHKLSNHGRNVGLYNPSIRDILFFVCRSSEPLSAGRIAQHIRGDENRYMSNEYKIIKRLCPLPQTVNRFTNNPRTKRYLNIQVAEDGSYTFVPNLRGFLAYLYNEFLVMRETKNYEKKIEREFQHLRRPMETGNIRFNQKIAQRIRKVLSNPLIIKIAPFLEYWAEFEKYGFNVVALLLKISVELQNQLHIDAYDDTYLVRRATERFFIALENFFLDRELYLMKRRKPLKELINNYRKLIVPLIRSMINKEVERLDFIQKESDEFEMLQELDCMVLGGRNEVISINKIGRQYSNSFKNSVSVLEIVRNKRKYEDYLLTDSFLISKSLVEKLKKLVSNKMSYPDVVLVFKHQNIPKECICDIMEKLGYQEKIGKLLGEDDFGTGRHISFIRRAAMLFYSLLITV